MCGFPHSLQHIANFTVASRFYPGLVSSGANFPRIQEASSPAGLLEGQGPELPLPLHESRLSTGKTQKSATGRGHLNAARSTRVTGALDHAMLPMPPVSFFLSSKTGEHGLKKIL
jgi:hypothetical protein